MVPRTGSFFQAWNWDSSNLSQPKSDPFPRIHIHNLVPIQQQLNHGASHFTRQNQNIRSHQKSLQLLFSKFQRKLWQGLWSNCQMLKASKWKFTHRSWLQWTSWNHKKKSTSSHTPSSVDFNQEVQNKMHGNNTINWIPNGKRSTIWHSDKVV